MTTIYKIMDGDTMKCYCDTEEMAQTMLLRVKEEKKRIAELTAAGVPTVLLEDKLRLKRLCIDMNIEHTLDISDVDGVTIVAVEI